MQAVILAAGLGTRLRPITLTTPKPLLKIDDKTIIEHTLSSLPSGIDEIFIVVNYLRDQIRTHLGEQWNRIPIHYIVQDPLNGTGGAMMLLRNRLQDRFLVVNGDDLYAKEDLEMMMNYSTSILLCPTENQLQNGADLNNEGLFIGLKVSDTQISYRVCGAYLLCLLYTSPSPRDRTRSRMPSSA